MGSGERAKGFFKRAGKALTAGASPVAIDFGTGALKLLQIDGGDQPQLIAAARVDTPDDLLSDPAGRLQFQTETLPRLVRTMKFRGKRAVCTIPATQTFCKPVQVGEGERSSSRGVVDHAVANQLGCDPRAIVTRQIEVGPVQGNKLEIAALATGRKLVERLMESVKTAKLEPVGIFSEFEAMVAGLASPTDEPEDASALYLDIGALTTAAAIAHGRTLAFARCLEVGGHHLDDAVGKQVKVGIERAREIRAQMDGPVQVAERSGASTNRFTKRIRHDIDLTNLTEMIVDEAQLCVRYHDSMFPQRPVRKVVFAGGEASWKGLCRHVAQGLRLPAQIADPLARVARSGSEPTTGVDLTQAQPGWAVPLGLCLSKPEL
ncbi:MAG: pilus assembly protein PilM [Planctomycetota bacterium]